VKRLRKGSETCDEMADTEVVECDVSAVRAALARRASEGAAPSSCIPAAEHHVTGTDASLCRLGQCIASALQTLRRSAEAARVELCSIRATLHAAVDSRCDDLEAVLLKAQSAKVAALERELIAVDAALERWRSETRVVQDAVASLSDTRFVGSACRSRRLVWMRWRRSCVPCRMRPVEPPHVGLSIDTPALLASIAGFGT